MSIDELIERLENAEGPNRWLDAKIDAAFRIGTKKMRGQGYEWAWKNFPTWAHHKQQRGMCGVQHANGDLGLVWDSMEFTSSIDAALLLLQTAFPGWGGLFSFGSGENIHRADIWSERRGTQSSEDEEGNPLVGEDADGEHASPAIALCIAILKAKQAQEVSA
ncbi:hypothetical protein E5S70_17605 [Ensifer adhaerens]|uniref:hypothetical protein n=1 Tax=Ensifer canadensis TaxID=555315 RepID=UPI00148FD0B8|nr:hypothetical protein [Ensifer canadensis]NOV17870.1 hypothetical protein [Ensifer canadensis]